MHDSGNDEERRVKPKHREGESVIINTKIGLITILHKVGYKCESTTTAVAAIATATATVPSAVVFPQSRQIEFGFDWMNLKKNRLR